MNELLELLKTDVIEASKRMLGCRLVYENLVAEIVETEAYRTPDDPGSHAHRGQTPRNQVMFGEAGRIYMYFTYGNHWMLNVTAHEVGNAAAVLIRAAKPIHGLETFRERRPKAKNDFELMNGPGKLCAAFGLDRSHYGLDLFGDGALRIEIGEPVREILYGTRIGLSVGCGEELEWRFVDSDKAKWASKPLPKKVI